MSTQPSLESSIQTGRELVAAIRHSSSHFTLAILLILFKTLVIPVLVFIAAWIVGGYFRAYLADTFQDPTLNSTAQFAAALATVALTIVAWRWSEARFGGLTLMRRLFGVVGAVAQVERAIDNARAQSSPDRNDLMRIETLAQGAWDTYVSAMRQSGIPVDQFE